MRALQIVLAVMLLNWSYGAAGAQGMGVLVLAAFALVAGLWVLVAGIGGLVADLETAQEAERLHPFEADDERGLERLR